MPIPRYKWSVTAKLYKLSTLEHVDRFYEVYPPSWDLSHQLGHSDDLGVSVFPRPQCCSMILHHPRVYELKQVFHYCRIYRIARAEMSSDMHHQDKSGWDSRQRQILVEVIWRGWWVHYYCVQYFTQSRSILTALGPFPGETSTIAGSSKAATLVHSPPTLFQRKTFRAFLKDSRSKKNFL
jgi:hypothetical protein